ncbi:hypothetical protein BU26DRAFT_270363 [Trematosphaeria pertusa]|uniref:Uncharacterized protein n=1 Tax=Trematosphaeria pertusa TaxID=390896 RepID=A0A6A6IKT8_9PLEO|nr:uncharacterized protein BU26DRAFT_270363 [Trematosphaeria pertusa]KAF2250807.1 hypothetical protein BU26DRAFT_270363 [Trematosphaeria pertusa]
MVESGHWADTARRRFVEGEKATEDEEGDDGEDSDEDEGSDSEAAGTITLRDPLMNMLESLEKSGFSASKVFWGNPIWCNARMGETVTKLPDGTLVQIGGEHEDFYDPDFLVYNDVIVFAPTPDGKSCRTGAPNFEIYGYPEEVFPETDFHTATHVPSLNAILILGNASREVEEGEGLQAPLATPIYLLKVGTWGMEKVETAGDGPGIIWNHKAELKDGQDVLRVAGVDGEWEGDRTQRTVVIKEGETRTVGVEFEEAWELDLANMRWTKEASSWVTVPKKKRGGKGAPF